MRAAVEITQNQHPIITQFLAAIGRACEAEKLNLSTIISPSQQRALHDIAQAIDDLYTANGAATADDIARMLKKEFNLDLKSEPGKGAYVRLQSIPRLPPEKHGQLTFATLGLEETAPRHIHKSPGHRPKLPGEVTVTLRGTLRFRNGDKVLTHTRNDQPRISPNDSVDDYLPQEEDWAGFYLQIRGAEAI